MALWRQHSCLQLQERLCHGKWGGIIAISHCQREQDQAGAALQKCSLSAKETFSVCAKLNVFKWVIMESLEL